MDVIYLALVLAAIVLLPWSQQKAGTWKRMQKWYNYLVAAFLSAMVPMALYYYTLASFATIRVFLGYIQVLFETFAIVSGIVGVVGMCKSLLLEK